MGENHQRRTFSFNEVALEFHGMHNFITLEFHVIHNFITLEFHVIHNFITFQFHASSRGTGIWRRCRFLWVFGVDADFYGYLA